MSTAAKTPNYNLSQVAGSDIPDWITDYTSDMSKIDDALKENADDIATVRPDEFSEESTYAAGDYCIKDNMIYKAKTAVEAGAFDISDWTATTIFNELSGLNQNMKWKLAGKTTGSTQLNVNSFLSMAKEFLLIVVFSYNLSNSKARIDHIVNADNLGNVLVSGYYFSPNSYASIGCIISESGYASISSTWWKVVESGNDIDLSDNTAELFVYYR